MGTPYAANGQDFQFGSPAKAMLPGTPRILLRALVGDDDRKGGRVAGPTAA